MDDKSLNQSLKETLTERAQHAVSNDYDLWSQIQEAIDTQEKEPMKAPTLRVAPSNPRRTRRLIYVLVAALLLTTTAVYAVYQTQLPPIYDQGVEAIKNEGYTTELNLVQRQGDVEVELDWGYIDSSRIVVNYQIFAIKPDGTRSTDHFYGVYKALLRNKEGLLKERMPSRDTAGERQPSNRATGTITYEYPERFDPSTMPDVMNFQLEVMIVEGKLSTGRSIEVMLRSLLPIPSGFMVPAEYLYEWPDWRMNPEVTAEPGFNSLEPMLFDFELPVQRAVILEPNQSVEVNGTAGILKKVLVSPSRLEITLCFTVPSGKEAWSPHTVITLGEQELLWSNSGMSTPPDKGGLTCSREDYNVYAEPGMKLDIEVTAIRRGPDFRPDDPQYLLDLQQKFAERGVHMDVHLNAEGKPSGYSFPATGSPEERAALIELGFLIEGPWEFTVEIPEP